MGTKQPRCTCWAQMVEDPRQATTNDIHFCPLHAQAEGLRTALLGLMSWRMRDGSPCSCPAGKDEDEPTGKMPTLHATSCEDARALLRAVDGK